MQPTAQQRDIIDLFLAGLDIVTEAGAGTGKTSTLDMLARAARGRRGQYMAFNRSIVDDAAMRFPPNVGCNTVHSLAMRAVGRAYRHRLGSGRERSDRLARRLGIQRMLVHYGTQPKVLQAGFLASLTLKGITAFCESDDEEPGPQHVPYAHGIDMPTGKGERTFVNNRAVAEALVEPMHRAWEDLCDVEGVLPYKPGHYLKLWELNDPQIRGDFLVIDEAQDLSPVMLSIARQQRDCQRVYVGDSAQQVYAWRGAVNALANVHADAYAELSQSFRFGQATAEVANLILERLGLPLRLVGHPAIDTVVDTLTQPDCILTRTNTVAVSTMLQAQREGLLVHLIGGGEEVAGFARGAEELMTQGSTSWYDLACFESWGEAKEYAANDPQGDELQLMVDLVEEYTAPTIITALGLMPDEGTADLVVSTAHKAKGREWDSVQLAHDFMDPADGGEEEWRLMYVALTRARYHVDIDRCQPLQTLLHSERGSGAQLLRLSHSETP